MKNEILLQKVAFMCVMSAFLLIATASVGIAQSTLPAPKQERLLNGLKLLMWSDAKADKVMVKIRVHAGSAFDPQGKEGAMQMLADNLFPSDASRDFFADDLGGGLEVVTTYDYIQINASSKPESFLQMLETLSTAISNPAIDKDITAKVRTALLAKLKILEADPAYVADQAVAKRLFGTFPYGRPQQGSTASVQKLDFADLIDAKQRFLTADNATIAISGNFNKDLAFRAVRRYFGGWLKSDKRVPSTFRQPDDPSTELLRVQSPKPDAAAIRFAIRGVARSDKDLAASLVFTTIMKNRAKTLVPSDHAADAFVRNEAHTLPGIITVGFYADPNYSGKENGKVIGFDLSTPIPESEFQTAKNFVMDEWAKKDISLFWLDADTYKLPSPLMYARAIDTVTIADVNSYAEKVRKLPVVMVLVSNPPKSN